MIEFEGIASQSTILRMKQKERNAALIGATVTFLLCSGLVLLASFLINFLIIYFLIVVALLAIFMIVLQKGMEKRIPKKLIIENGMMMFLFDKGEVIKNISDVKKVYDKGDWYEFNCFFPHRNINLLCQKDWIKQGTIEEFEKLFEDKLVRE